MQSNQWACSPQHVIWHQCSFKANHLQYAVCVLFFLVPCILARVQMCFPRPAGYVHVAHKVCVCLGLLMTPSSGSVCLGRPYLTNGKTVNRVFFCTRCQTHLISTCGSAHDRCARTAIPHVASRGRATLKAFEWTKEAGGLCLHHYLCCRDECSQIYMQLYCD